MPSISANYTLGTDRLIDAVLITLHKKKRIDLINLPKKTQIIKIGYNYGMRYHFEFVVNNLYRNYLYKQEQGHSINDLIKDIANVHFDPYYKPKYLPHTEINKLITTIQSLTYYKFIFENKDNPTKVIGIFLTNTEAENIERVLQHLVKKEIPIVDLPSKNEIIETAFKYGMILNQREILNELTAISKKSAFYNGKFRYEKIPTLSPDQISIPELFVLPRKYIRKSFK